MTFTIITKKFQQTFNSGDVLNITSGRTGDCCINFGFDYVLTLQYDANAKVCRLSNPLNCDIFAIQGAAAKCTIRIYKYVQDNDKGH